MRNPWFAPAVCVLAQLIGFGGLQLVDGAWLQGPLIALAGAPVVAGAWVLLRRHFN